MTSGSARAKLQATSQPKNEPSPRPTYVYMPPADGRCRASSAIENAVNRTAIIAKSTASGVMPPANDVAAPIESAVATAGAMWVMDWNSTSGNPMALRSSDGVPPETSAVEVTGMSSSDASP